MSYNLYLTERFQKEAKKLNKKYPSFKQDYNDFLDNLESNPVQGSPLGKSCYKIRLRISSKSKGKSGGARVITHIHISEMTIYLLSIYDKGEKESLSQRELEELMAQIENEKT